MDALLGLAQRFSTQKWIPFLLTLTLFVLPLSSTAKSICLSLSIVAILLAPSYRNKWFECIDEGWCKTAILLFAIAAIACLWSSAGYTSKLLVLEKYSKLLYLPILAIGFRDEVTRKTSLHAFLAAMFLTSGLALLKFHGFLPSLNIDPDRLFRNHIMVGYMLDFAAYISALFAYRQRDFKRLGYGSLFFLFSYHVLFINGGRMGYVVYFLSIFLLILQLFSWRQAIIAIAMVCMASAFIYSQSPFMKERIQLLKTQYEGYQHNDSDNSVGFRLKFHNYARALFKEHPFIGLGTGGFRHQFDQDNPVPGWGHSLLEPHSQYWLIADEFGLIGIIIFLIWLGALLKASWQLEQMRPLAWAMLLSFILGNLTDSLLLYSGSGYFFILFMGLCLGEHSFKEDNNR